MAQVEVGIIYVINYTLFDENFDEQKLAFQVKDLANGFFGYAKYLVSSKIEIYYIVSLAQKKSQVSNEKISPNCIIKKLTIEGSGEDRKYKEDFVANFGAVNLGNKDVLSSVLIFTENQIKAKNYILFFFNHSSNFGLFESAADAASGVLSGRTFHFASEYIKKNSLKLFRHTDPASIESTGKELLEIRNEIQFGMNEIAKDFKGDMLTSSELHVALYRAFLLNKIVNGEKPTKNHVKILFNAGCYTQNIDTSYSLKDTCDFIVGAESAMPERSFDYPFIINTLIGELESKQDSDQIDYEALINLVINKFSVPFIEESSDAVKKQLNWTFISGIKCSALESLKDRLNTFVMICLKDLGLFDKIKTVKDQMKDISKMRKTIDENRTPLYIYDIKDFFTRLLSLHATNDELNLWHPLLNESLKSLVLGELFLGIDALENEQSNFHGISLYFPLNIEEALETYNFNTFYSPYSKLQSFFAKDSYWQEFLLVYFKKQMV